MIPIITDSVEIERVSIYNASVLRSNPLNGVRLTTPRASICCKARSRCSIAAATRGDARIDNVPPGQERLLSYGIDLDMHRRQHQASPRRDAVVTAKIVQGRLILSRQARGVADEYAADNKIDEGQDAHHRASDSAQGWKLVDTQKPLETTPAVYRFKGAAAPGKVTTLTVKEES